MSVAVRKTGRRVRVALLLAVVASAGIQGRSVAADGPGAQVCPRCHRTHGGTGKHPGPAYGTLGYGPPGVFPGFQGFGLGYHLGHGYGGDALGVGADGGFPFYGGPGYPHPAPPLKRFGGNNPFPFHGGPGFPTAECRNYYAPTGPLESRPPVIDIAREPGEAEYGTGYGNFSGVVAYPESTFAPFTSRAAARGSSGGVSPGPRPNALPGVTP